MSTERDFESLRPVLYTALSHLVRSGFPVSPSEGEELIHDFFVDAWEGLNTRYDPELAKFSTYMYRAFIYFARPRIVEGLRWQRSLAPFDELERAKTSVGVESVTGPHDLRVVREAYETLDDPDAALLRARLVDGASEREVAESFEMTRYRVRQACAKALGRLILAVGEVPTGENARWQLARLTWGEGRCIDDAAARLGWTVHQARAEQKELLRELASRIRGV